MEETDQKPLAAEETQNGSGGRSAMDALRRKHAELAEGKTVKMPIPGYDGDLVAEYRLLDVTKELDRIQTNVRNTYKKLGEVALYATLDVLATACIGLYYFNGEELRPLSESIGPDEPPICYDDRLVEFLGLDISGAEGSFARETVKQTFGGNEQAIIDHGRRLNSWMSNTSNDVSEGFLSMI
jgi:hypothetical protein